MEGHAEAAQEVNPPKPSPVVGLTALSSVSNKEVFTSSTQRTITVSTPSPVPAAITEEEDDTSVPVKPGSLCRRNGCKVSFVSDEVNRQGGGKDAVCTYHPGSVRMRFPFFIHLPPYTVQPIFHEGSKVCLLMRGCAT